VTSYLVPLRLLHIIFQILEEKRSLCVLAPPHFGEITVFRLQVHFTWRKSATLCEYCQRQSCTAFTGLFNHAKKDWWGTFYST